MNRRRKFHAVPNVVAAAAPVAQQQQQPPQLTSSRASTAALALSSTTTVTTSLAQATTTTAPAVSPMPTTTSVTVGKATMTTHSAATPAVPLAATEAGIVVEAAATTTVRQRLCPPLPAASSSTTTAIPALNNNSSPPSSPLQLYAERDPLLCEGGGGGCGNANACDGGADGSVNLMQQQQYNTQPAQQLYIDKQLQPRAYPLRMSEMLPTLNNDAAANLLVGADGHPQQSSAEETTAHKGTSSRSDDRSLVVVGEGAENRTAADLEPEHKEKRKAPTAKDKLVDRKRFTMSDLVKWKPKTENTLRRKWAERRKKLREEDAADGETEQDQQQQKGGTATQHQGSSSRSASTTATTPATAAGPRVMINERGEMVVDEQSLVVVENPEQNTDLETVNDDLFPKRVTSLSFRRKPHRSSVWGVLETDLFYEVLSATGTDFGLMHEFIPTRSRVELKNKFNREQRTNARRLDEVLEHPTLLDERLRQRVERMLVQMGDQ